MLEYRKAFFTPYFINCYIIPNERPRLVLIFENSDYVPLIHAMQKLYEHPCYLDCQYADDNKEVVMYFEVPPEYLKDFYSFIEGKYSGFTEGYKDLLAHLCGRNSGLDYKVTIYDAIYPTEKKRKLIELRLDTKLDNDAEVFDKPDLKEEEYIPISELREEKAV